MASYCLVNLVMNLSTSGLVASNGKRATFGYSPSYFFVMISENLIHTLRIVNCSLYTRRIALKRDYQKEKLVMLANIYVDVSYLVTPTKTFIITSRHNQFYQENVFQQRSS